MVQENEEEGAYLPDTKMYYKTSYNTVLQQG